MKARILLAVVIGALVGLPVGALALRQSAPDRSEVSLTLADDDGTADQGHGDAPGAAASRRDDGNDISGPCDEAEHANDPRCTGAGNKDDDSGHHSGSGSGDDDDDDSGHHSGSGSGDDDDDDSGSGSSDD